MRKLGLISSLWAALLFFPLAGFTLGLGEIETSSFLNQPLKAEIEVISARPGEIDDLLISLASRDAFEKAGLERPVGLSKIRFKVEKSEDGLSAKILVSTKTPVKEPFLSFLVEADWAKGRLLREFTVLLDPMSFAQQAIKTVPQVTPEQTPLIEPVAYQPDVTETTTAVETPVVDQSPQQAVVQPVAQPIAMPAEPSLSDQEVPSEADTEYLAPSASTDQIVVSKGDTLWAIASQFKDENHSMAQVMLAMQMMSPDAFTKDNINNLKVGAVLRVPDMDAMDRLTRQEAYAQVLEQNGLWDEYVARKSGATSVAMAGSPTETESPQQESDSQLSLLTPDDGDSDSASLQNDANSDNAGQIRKQLAFAEEELEAARLENNDLKSRIEMLEQQQEKFEELQKLVQIEDSSLAQLQQNTAEEDALAEEVVAVEAGTTITGDMTETGEQAADDMAGMVEDEEQIGEKPSDVMIEAAGEMLAEDSEQGPELAETVSTDEMMEEILSSEAETVIQTTAEEADEMLAEEQMGQPEIATVAAPAPVIVTEEPGSTLDGGLTDLLPSMDELLADPVMLGGIGAIFALLLGFVFLKRKKSDKDEDGITLEEPDGLLDDDETPIHVPSTTQITVDEEEEDQVKTAVIDTEISMAETASDAGHTEEEDDFSKTAIISAEELPEAEAQPAEIQHEQDDVLNEVDVYLAYGLYDNAEDLLNESLRNSPDRADYRAKLLDTYFATKNKAAFVKEAEILKTLGGAADRFWDRVQIMGFELAPENEMFSGAIDSDVSVEDLGYAKPETADLDIGSDDDVTDFSNTDFDLSDDAFDISATQVIDSPDDDFSKTQDIDSLDVDFPDLLGDEAESAEKSDNLPDDIAGDELNAENELDFDLEDDDSEDALSFDLPDDLDLSAEDDSAAEMIELDPTVEAAPSLNEVPPLDEDELEINFTQTDNDVQEANDELTSETLVMPPTDLEVGSDSLDSEIASDEDLDLDMSHIDDAGLQTGDFHPSESLALSESKKEDDITEFQPADVTGEFDAFIAEATDEDAIVEVDTKAGREKTGTYAPGDFNEEDLITDIDDIGDIEGLMLPDDVDEVGTKLDLAKAFIDMGDAEGARTSLEEVLTEGSDEQKAEATGLLEQIK